MHAEYQEEPPRAAAPDSVVFVPPTVEHADRIARRLLERYRRKTLSECQHAVARMYGYPQWQALQAAVAAGTPASAYDEDETKETVHARRERHRDVALVWLAGVSDAMTHSAQLLDRVLLGQGAHTISQRYDPMYNRKRL
ncbi:MAG: hypothetical protein ACM3SS_18455, partial [Rhodospirillaceae bacterium]